MTAEREPDGADASTLWQVEMFGRLRAVRSGGAQTVIERFQTRKTALLFALLALRPGERVAHEDLTLRL